MEQLTLTISGYSAAIFHMGSLRDCPVIYTHLSYDTAEAVAKLLIDTKIVLIALEGADWDRDLTPWPAKRAFRGGNDFSGGADTYLRELTENIIPTAEKTLGIVPSSRMILGYSLAGMFSLYALYRTELFDCAASVSGSLWYDGFIEFLQENQPVLLPKRVYFSLGDRESVTKNRRLAAVEDCTAEAEQIMRTPGVKTIFELNPGNHFADVPERIAKAIRWIS